VPLLLLLKPPESLFLHFLFPFLLPLPLSPLLGLGQEREGLPEDMVVPAMVDMEAAAIAEDALLLRARSRMQRPVPGPLSCSAQSPRV
jgi:hypothetical protein